MYPRIDFSDFARMAYKSIEFEDNDKAILARQTAKSVFSLDSESIRTDVIISKSEKQFNLWPSVERLMRGGGAVSDKDINNDMVDILKRIESFADDYGFLCENSEGVLLHQPLWLKGDSERASLEKDQVIEIWDKFARSLSIAEKFNQNWRFWYDWHRSIIPLEGSAPSSAFGEVIDVEIATQPSEFWERDPDEVMADIAEIVRGNQTSYVPGTLDGAVTVEPEIGAQEGGFIFTAQSGALTHVPSFPHGDEAADPTQAKLFERLKRRFRTLQGVMDNSLARYPALADVLADYRNALAVENIADLDIDELWLSGAGLISQAQAFASLDETRQVTEPLEPEQQALLGEIARLHGAFIMGFQAGQVLAERSQIPLLSPETARTLLEHERSIVRGLLESTELALSDSARTLFQTLDHVLAVTSEKIETRAVAGYPVLRNLLIFSAKRLSYAVGVASVGSSLLGVPVHLAVQGMELFLLNNLGDILGFAGSVPELRAYIEYHLTRLEIDYRDRHGEDED